jgi:hypothetical protein
MRKKEPGKGWACIMNAPYLTQNELRQLKVDFICLWLSARPYTALHNAPRDVVAILFPGRLLSALSAAEPVLMMMAPAVRVEAPAA